MTTPFLMIVEDDEDLCEALVLLFEARGSRTVVARDGLDALAKLAGDERPAVILLDLRMPRMNGIEFLHAVSGTALQSIPVLAMTGDVGACNEAVSAGAARCLSKPIDPRSLFEAVQDHLARGATSNAAAAGLHDRRPTP